jgi:hypothetical protein
MQLHIIVDDHSMNIDVPDSYLEDRRDGLDRLDADMDRGIQLGRDWIEHPEVTERCQFAADKLLAAIESHNEGLAMLAAGYILSRRPGTRSVRIDTGGEPGETELR